MNKFKVFLYKKYLPGILSRLSKSPLIPRSGEEGARVNCFSVALDRDGGPYLLVTGIDNDKLYGKEWDGNSFAIESDIPLAEVNDSHLTIRHYYGLSEIRYTGILDLIIGRISLWPYIKVHFIRTVEKVDQYFFHKKKFFTMQRIELLRFLVNHHFDSGGEGTGVFDLMTKLYSIKWVSHPEGDAQRKKLELYLESFG